MYTNKQTELSNWSLESHLCYTEYHPNRELGLYTGDHGVSYIINRKVYGHARRKLSLVRTGDTKVTRWNK